MELRNGKQTPLSSLSRVPRQESQPFRLLDLPIEIRLMIYGYAFGSEDIHWTMTFESTPKPGFILALGRIDAQSVIQRNVDLLRQRHGLLQTCRQVSQEAFPPFHDQTCFNIGFSLVNNLKSRPGYWLQLTSGRFKLNHGLARAVFWRVNHVRFNFVHEPNFTSYIWEIHLLRILLGHGAWLKSLQVVANGNVRFNHRGRPDFDRLEAGLYDW